MKWITRENGNVDRVACPWLIRRFIDPQVELVFAPEEDVMRIAQETGAIPYDVKGVELGHVDGRCSFESIILKYGLTEDKALQEMAKIVHAADVKQDRSQREEAPGLYAIACGFALLHGMNDLRKVELEAPMYDALYAWCQATIQG